MDSRIQAKEIDKKSKTKQQDIWLFQSGEEVPSNLEIQTEGKGNKIKRYVIHKAKKEYIYTKKQYDHQGFWNTIGILNKILNRRIFESATIDSSTKKINFNLKPELSYYQINEFLFRLHTSNLAFRAWYDQPVRSEPASIVLSLKDLTVKHDSNPLEVLTFVITLGDQYKDAEIFIKNLNYSVSAPGVTISFANLVSIFNKGFILDQNKMPAIFAAFFEAVIQNEFSDEETLPFKITKNATTVHIDNYQAFKDFCIQYFSVDLGPLVQVRSDTRNTNSREIDSHDVLFNFKKIQQSLKSAPFPLITAISDADNIQFATVKKLIDSGHDVNEQKKQDTPLTVACRLHKLKIAKHLLANGATRLPFDHEGYHDLYYSSSSSFDTFILECVSLEDIDSINDVQKAVKFTDINKNLNKFQNLDDYIINSSWYCALIHAKLLLEREIDKDIDPILDQHGKVIGSDDYVAERVELFNNHVYSYAHQALLNLELIICENPSESHLQLLEKWKHQPISEKDLITNLQALSSSEPLKLFIDFLVRESRPFSRGANSNLATNLATNTLSFFNSNNNSNSDFAITAAQDYTAPTTTTSTAAPTTMVPITNNILPEANQPSSPALQQNHNAYQGLLFNHTGNTPEDIFLDFPDFLEFTSSPRND